MTILPGAVLRPPQRYYESSGHPYWILAIKDWGQTDVFRSGGWALSRVNMLGLIAPGTAYSIDSRNPRPFTSTWCLFEGGPEWQNLLQWPELIPGVSMLRLAKSTHDEFLRMFNELIDYDSRELRCKEELKANCLHRMLLLASEYYEVVDPRLASVVDLMGRNLHRPVSITEMAESTCLSPSRFAHLFRQEMGRSPKQYHDELRMGRAKQLLKLTYNSIDEIAGALGFSNRFHFAVRFKKITGMTPAKFRAQS